MQSWGLLRAAFAEREALDGVKGGLKGDQVFVLRRFRGISGLFRGQPFCGERKQLAFPTAGHQKAGATIVENAELKSKPEVDFENGSEQRFANRENGRGRKFGCKKIIKALALPGCPSPP